MLSRRGGERFKTNSILVFLLSGRFKHSHSTRKHKLGKYGIVRRWVVSINVIIHHFTRNRNQRSTSEENPINV
jgi:hypothetical protein